MNITQAIARPIIAPLLELSVRLSYAIYPSTWFRAAAASSIDFATSGLAKIAAISSSVASGFYSLISATLTSYIAFLVSAIALALSAVAVFLFTTSI